MAERFVTVVQQRQLLNAFIAIANIEQQGAQQQWQQQQQNRQQQSVQRYEFSTGKQNILGRMRTELSSLVCDTPAQCVTVLARAQQGAIVAGLVMSARTQPRQDDE